MKRKVKPIILNWVETEHTDYSRPWPDLRYESGEVALIVHSDERYVPWKAACSEHKPLLVSVVNHAMDPPEQNRVIMEFESLVHIKIWMKNFLKDCPHHIPKT